MNADMVRIPFLDLFEAPHQFLPGTMPLGVDRDGKCFIIDLLAPDVQHILVAAERGGGKTVLMRSAALSLALLTGQPWMQMAIIEPRLPGENGTPKESFSQLESLPHLLWPIARKPREVKALLQFLVQETSYRVREQIETPRLVILVDRLSALLATDGESYAGPLRTLLEQEASGAPHLILGIDDAEAAAEFLPLERVTTRLVGGPDDGAVASGLGSDGPATDMGAAPGAGHFSVDQDGILRSFKAAYADEFATAVALDELYRRCGPALLARPLPPTSAGSTLIARSSEEMAGNSFSQS